MKTSSSQPSTVPAYRDGVDLKVLESRLDALVTEIAASALSSEALARSFDAGLDDMAAVLRAVPVHEGRLLERGISLIAERNPDLVVLTQNLRLPVTVAAMQLVEKNDPHLYRSLTLDADSGGRKSYTPDLLILNRRIRVAHVIDIKRSLSSYEVSRIAELKNRMLASALVVPDLLYKEHRRLVADEVRVVILNAESQRCDIDGGIWPLSHLDHLLEITGAGEAMTSLRRMFKERVEANWVSARRQVTATRGVVTSFGTPSTAPASEPMGEDGEIGEGEASTGGEDGNPRSDRVLRVGFARLPSGGRH